MNDTLIFLGITTVTMFSGTLVNVLGWKTINLYAILPVLVIMTGIIKLIYDPRKNSGNQK